MPMTKAEREADAQDKLNKAEYDAYERYKAQEKIDNEAPRKALSDAYDYVKDKASGFVSDLGKGARNYGRLYQQGLGMKPDTPMEKKKGGMIKQKSASSRADGIAQKGKTRGKMY